MRMHSGITTFFILATALMSVHSIAQNGILRRPIQDVADRVFAPISAGEEFSHAWIGQIVADSQGFLWFATRDGLDRYDGYQIRHYSPEPSDPNNGVFVQECCKYALYTDEKGTIWLGGNGSFFHYDPISDSFQAVKFPTGQQPGLIRNVDQGKNGELWLSSNRGLIRYVPKTNAFTRFAHQADDPASLRNDYIRGTLEATDGSFWVATNSSIEVLDRSSGKVAERYELRNPLQPSVSTGNAYVRLLEDHDGVIWIASARDGLAFVDRRAKKLVFVRLEDRSKPQPGAWCLLEDHLGQLWVGTERGLLRFNRSRDRIVRYRNDPSDLDSLPADWVLALHEDREGGIWVGTANAGVARLSSADLPFRRYRRNYTSGEPFGTNYVLSAFEENPNLVWAGTKGAINRINLTTGQYTSSLIAENTEVGAIVKDPAGYIWLGTYDGSLFRFNPATNTIAMYGHKSASSSGCGNNEVRALLVDHSGTLWAGAGAELCSYDPIRNRFDTRSAKGMNASEIDALAEDRLGRLWIGSRHAGLTVYNPRTGQFNSFRHSVAKNSLSNDGVTSVLIDRSGSIWVGTLDGLNLLDPNSYTFKTFFERDGLPSDSVNGIVEDERGDLWITTSHGLAHFRQGSRSFYTYFRSDGVFDDLTGAWKGSSGNLLLGSYSGLTVLSPKEVVEQEPPPPPVVLTELKIADRPVQSVLPLPASIEFTKQIQLSHGQDTLSFEFAALSFVNPKQTVYRYRLVNLETSWNEVASTQRLARYTSLPPGKYVFEVQAKTIHGTWTSQGAQLQVVILPPWWSTWWFRALCALLIAAMIRQAYQYRVAQLSRQLDLRYKERLRERTRIAQDLHDTLLQNIAGLCLQIGGLSKVVVAMPELARERLKDLRQQGEECLREARQAVWNIRSLDSAENDLATELQDSVERLTAGTPVRGHFRLEGEARAIPLEYRDHLLRIGREAIINAVRHSQAKEVEVRMHFENDRLTLTVQDDGRGLGPNGAEALTGHFGMTTMRERAQEMNAKLRVTSAPERGTSIGVTVRF
jgi:ligand-binding sensor domain-containing protein/signal transduction histidine kinase